MANKQAAIAFAKKWKDKGNESSDTEAFWRELMQKVFEVPDAYDDKIVKREDKIPGEKSTRSKDIVIYKGSGRQILVEQKSLGTNLSRPEKQSGTDKLMTPYEQADRYDGMSAKYDKASYIIVCNFSQFWIYDRNRIGKSRSFPMTQLYLEDMPKHLDKLWMLEYEKVDPGRQEISQNELHAKAAGDLVKKLYDCLLKGYPDGNEKKPSEETMQSLNELCVRIVFCLYAEDAYVFSPDSDSMFRDYLNKYDPDDWHDALQSLFKVLNTKEKDRPFATKKALQEFPYVNGGLFKDDIELPVFSDEAKHIINEMSEEFDWATINPTIFGAMFESTLNQDERRKEGMHYTSLENIHKVIDPLFLEDLKERLVQAESYKRTADKNAHLHEFQDYLASLTFFEINIQKLIQFSDNLAA